MKRIMIDDELRKKFGEFDDDYEICDADGNVIATLHRSIVWSDPDAWLELTPVVGAEELELADDDKGHEALTHQVIDQLRKLK